MIVTPKDLYSKIAEESGIDYSLIESIGSTVFQSLNKSIHAPDHLSYELPKLGTFTIRFAKTEGRLNAIKDKIEKKDEKFLKYLEYNPDIVPNLEKIVEKMQEYREDKKLSKTKRYEEKDCNESSEDQSEEC